MSVTRGQCDANGYLPSPKATLPIGWYQIILLGNRGACVLTTCPRLHSTARRPGFEPATYWSQVQCLNDSATEPHSWYQPQSQWMVSDDIKDSDYYTSLDFLSACCYAKVWIHKAIQQNTYVATLKITTDKANNCNIPSCINLSKYLLSAAASSSFIASTCTTNAL